MATKLKNLSLTSVDLVRAGANQEADICLHKSADGTEEPTERETNILKRFINWLKENPTEGDQEPENTIEKADEEQESAEVCKSAIYESIKSIIADDSLTVEERSAMIEKSLGQYHDKMVELAKFNPYHGADGRFASANGASGGASGGNKQKKPRDMHYMLRPKNGRGGKWYTDEKVAGEKYVRAYAADGFDTLIDLQNYDVIVNKSDIVDVEDVEKNDSIDIEADISIEYDIEKSDIVEVEVVKFNPYHGKDGRFASANGYATFTYAPGKSKAHDLAIQREKDRQAAAGGGAKQEEKKPQGGAGKYDSEIDGADSLDKLDEIVERAANDDSLSNKEYEAIYSKAMSRAQSWDPQNQGKKPAEPTSEKPKTVSSTSTGGKLVDMGGGQLYGENDNGFAASILDCGKSDINLYKYGSKQIYEVDYYNNTGKRIKPKAYATTKKEAKGLAQDWLNKTKSIDTTGYEDFSHDENGGVSLPF